MSFSKMSSPPGLPLTRHPEAERCEVDQSPPSSAAIPLFALMACAKTVVQAYIKYKLSSRWAVSQRCALRNTTRSITRARLHDEKPC